MDFSINESELAALCGLPHIQQLAYLRGIHPYMDMKTGLVGIKRGISYQSIAEQLYVEPHPGIKSVSYSRAQMIRAVAGLERAGLVSLESRELQLVLKCEKATLHFSVQNKAVTNPSQQAVLLPIAERPVNTGNCEGASEKAVIPNPPKAVTPLIKDNYIYLLSAKFEKFWDCYPEKKSSNKAWMAFEQLNPDPTLYSQILQAIENQKTAREARQLKGSWVPPWKYPANWLEQRCWEDEITLETTRETPKNAHGKNTANQGARDPFGYYEEAEDECPDEHCALAVASG